MVKQFHIQNKKISYFIEGKGPTIVFLHGFLEDRSIWNAFADSLKNHFKTIAIDLPGFGQSDIIEETHGMDTVANVVFEVLKNENTSKVIIIGHSMGGYVGLEMLRKNESMIKGLVLINSQAGADDEIAKKNRDRTIKIVENNHSKFISEFIPTLFKEDNVKKYKNEIQQLTASSLSTSDKGIIAALRGMKVRKDSISLLGNTKVPVLFVIGKHDSKIPIEKMKDQIIVPRISETLILENSGHMSFIEEEDICRETIKNFASKHSK